MSEINLTAENFDNEVLNSDKPVLVDFWASWCGPCQMLAPTIEEIANEYSDQYKICKVNVDEEKSLAQRFKILSIPTLMVFKNGENVNTGMGFMPKNEVLNLLK